MATDGFNEIYMFGEEWKGTKNFTVLPVGHFVFCADVTYDSPARGVEVQSCTVKIFRNGMEDGNIEIYAKGNLDNETHHLAYSEKWQQYKFDKRNNALVVEGKSNKMGGIYNVTLSPNGKVASFI